MGQSVKVWGNRTLGMVQSIQRRWGKAQRLAMDLSNQTMGESNTLRNAQSLQRLGACDIVIYSIYLVFILPSPQSS